MTDINIILDRLREDANNGCEHPVDFMETAQEFLKGLEGKKFTQCPCTLADKPCHSQCSCTNPEISYGCDCCTRYGSEEQKKRTANRVVETCSRKDIVSNFFASYPEVLKDFIENSLKQGDEIYFSFYSVSKVNNKYIISNNYSRAWSKPVKEFHSLEECLLNLQILMTHVDGQYLEVGTEVLIHEPVPHTQFVDSVEQGMVTIRNKDGDTSELPIYNIEIYRR